MNALTVCQPYAHLIALGEKPIENRTWPTPFRGELAIHAGLSREWLAFDDEVKYSDMAFGAIVAIATLTACIHINALVRGRVPPRYLNLALSAHANGPWCFVCERVRRLRTPVPCRGAQMIWTVPEPIAAMVLREVAA